MDKAIEGTVRALIEDSIKVKQEFMNVGATYIEKSSGMIISSLRKGKKILFFGNGGSAADAQHLAGEFINRFLFDRPALPGIALTTDTSVLTCIANDSDYRFIFSRQIEAIGQAGDTAIGISTSGNSPNVVEGLKAARQKGISTIALVGMDRGKVGEYADLVITVPSKNTPRIQEVHIMTGHIICQLVENAMFPDKNAGEKGCLSE